MKLTKKEIGKIEKARKHSIKKEQFTNDIICELEEKIGLGDLCNTNCLGGSSSNLEEAITCYIDYGEESIEFIKSVVESIKG